MSLFAENGYTMENAWDATGNEEALADSPERENITDARVRDSRLDDGTVIKNVVFFIKGGKPKSFKLSPYNEQFAAGTKIDVDSAVISEFKNQDGELTYTVTCEEA